MGRCSLLLEDRMNLIRTEYGLEDVQALYKYH